jgi:hypothetical protein
MAGLLAIVLTGSASHKPGHGGGGSGTTLKATFRDCTAGFPSASFANLYPSTPPQDLCPVAEDRIQSDTGQSYDSGVQNVSVELSGNGNFTLEVKSGRDIYLNFTDCVSEAATCPPNEPRFLPAGDVDGNFGTELGQRARLFVVGLGNLAVGQSAALDAELLLARLVDRVDGEEEVWWVTYRSNPSQICPAGSSAPLMGRRTGTNTWEIEAGVTNPACFQSMAPKPKGDNSEEFHGAYLMPFMLTITTQ